MSLKRPQSYCTDEKLSARDEWYKVEVAELGKLSRLIKWQGP